MVSRAKHFDLQRSGAERHRAVSQTLSGIETESRSLPSDEDLLDAIIGSADKYRVLRTSRPLDLKGKLSPPGVPSLGQPFAAPEVIGRIGRNLPQDKELKVLARDSNPAECLVERVPRDDFRNPLVDVKKEEFPFGPNPERFWRSKNERCGLRLRAHVGHRN